MTYRRLFPVVYIGGNFSAWSSTIDLELTQKERHTQEQNSPLL
jgi:hypothetical protein